MFGSPPLLLLSLGNNNVGIRPSSGPFRRNNNIPKNNSDKIDIEALTFYGTGQYDPINVTCS